MKWLLVILVNLSPGVEEGEHPPISETIKQEIIYNSEKECYKAMEVIIKQVDGKYHTLMFCKPVNFY